MPEDETGLHNRDPQARSEHRLPPMKPEGGEASTQHAWTSESCMCNAEEASSPVQRVMSM